MITGSTRLVGIVGSPVSQVASPANFNAHFATTGADIAMIPLDIDAEAIDAFTVLLRGWKNLLGCVVTVPYKQTLVPHLDALSARSAALGAVNVIRREADGRLIGDMTDGAGFLAAAQAHGFRAAGQTALIAGAGGAGSAIAYALCEARIGHLTLGDIDRARADLLAKRLGQAFPEVEIDVGLTGASHADLLVNATPAGMDGTTAFPVPAGLLKACAPHVLVADVVTSPVMTPLLLRAQELGCRIQTGIEMAAAQMQALGAFMQVMLPDHTSAELAG
ncbi:shikimate dehydrogenase family protein [Paraburkholderia xenovorans]|uniref:shikimate dehydrogenase family protein n=1 Tax=Paraburkholderia xenovorans TaxID=36873 RepID=UPI0006748FF2|nr:shikimate dehydrogenase [Paraburkholderia xenovorans]